MRGRLDGRCVDSRRMTDDHSRHTHV